MGESFTGQSYVLVIKDDASKYCLLEPCRAADAAACADAFLRFISLLGVCKFRFLTKLPLSECRDRPSEKDS